MTRRVVVGLLVLAGCAGGELRGRARAIDGVVAKAEENGAKKCAPHELAMAQSHLAFARQELSEGDSYRARQELDVSEVNAKAAVDKSPREKCAPRVAVIDPDDKSVVVVQRLDTDKDKYFDDEDGCPTEPEDYDDFQDDDGCPDPDNDKDHILDGDDKCPLVAEDPDGHEDEDGCPDEDNDGDGLADKIDACPDSAEDKDGWEDDDGCPDPDNDGDKIVDYPTPDDKCPNDPNPDTADGCPAQKYTLIVVTKEKIELKQTIFFAFRKAKIKKQSYPLLNEVAQALKDNPTIKVRIEGHTDNVGSDKFNKKLSQKRAESVRRYLVKKGIKKKRMQAKGFGETVPIADNQTEEGRAQNRRVEFIITSPPPQ